MGLLFGITGYGFFQKYGVCCRPFLAGCFSSWTSWMALAAIGVQSKVVNSAAEMCVSLT